MPSDRPKWFIRHRPRQDPEKRLICFPFAGGTSSSYTSWVEKLPAGLELISVQLPGREARFNEALGKSVGDVVDQMMVEFERWRDRPYSIFGHSLGALLAFEFVRRLESIGGRQPDSLIVSGKRAPQEPLTGVLVHSLPEEQFIRHIEEYQVTPEEVLADSQLLNLLLPRLRADFAMSETYCCAPGPRLTSPLFCFGGTDDPETEAPLLERWQEQASDGFLLRRFAGDHFFIFTNEEFVATLSRILHEGGRPRSASP